MSFLEQREIGKTGLKVDTLGFGCAPLGNLYRTVADSDARALLKSAIDIGFKYYDTAPHYGQGLSERRTGDALRTGSENDFVISTKVGRLLKPATYASERHGFVSPMPFDIEYDYSYDGIMRSFEDSLQRLGRNHIDILYVHDIGEATHGKDNERHMANAMNGGYKALDELRSQGMVKAIGLGVNEFEVCEQALDHGDWDCFLLAGRYTLLEQKALSTFFPKCEARNCSVIIGGPYNSGILASGVQGDKVPYYNYEPATQDIIERVRKIETLCTEFGVNLPAAALQFPLAHRCVASVIPGIGRIAHTESTVALFNEKIPSDFWQALKQNALISEDAPLPASKD